MSNQFLPIAYAYTNTGVFDSNDGINFITGLDANDSLVTVTADTLGNRIVVYHDHIFLGNSTVNATINSTMYTGSANAANVVVTTPGGSNTHIQFNDSTVFGGTAGLTFNKTANTLTVSNTISINTRPFATTLGVYNVVYDGNGSAAFLAGGTGDSVNYYRNSLHYFQSIGGSTLQAVIGAGGLLIGNSTVNTVTNSTNFYINGAGLTAYATATVGSIPGNTAPGAGTPLSGFVGYRMANSGSASMIGAGTGVGVVTLTLPVGVWDIEGQCIFSGAGATSSSDWVFGVFNASGNVNSGASLSTIIPHDRRPAATDIIQTLNLLRTRIVVSPSPQTIYFNAAAVFTISTYSATVVGQATLVC
jgi:hypothetical protein